MARIAALVVTWNGRRLLERFLPPLVAAARESRHAVRLYVIDNGSTDGTREWLAAIPEVVTVPNDRTRTWAGGNNAGARRAQADGFAPDWLVFLNNDVLVDPGFFDRLLDVPDDPRLAIVGPKMRFLHRAVALSVRFGPDRTCTPAAGALLMELMDLPDECRTRVRPTLPRGGRRAWVLSAAEDLLVPLPAPRRWTALFHHRNDSDTRLCLRVVARAHEHHASLGVAGSARIDLDVTDGDLVDVVNNAGTWIDDGAGECGDIGFAQVDRGQYDRSGRVDAVCGAAMAVRTSAFARLHGFDEGYRFYFEDTDFCARAAEQGLRAWYNPGAAVRHLHSATAREHSPFWSAHVTAGSLRFRRRFQDPRRFAAWARQHSDPAVRSLQSWRTTPVGAHLFEGRALCR